MSTEISVLDLAKGLQQSASNSAEESAAFLKFAKGEWTWGAEDNEVEPDALWAIHPQGFQHGWIAWGDKAHGNESTKLGEIIVPATEPLPLGSSLADVEGRWDQQVAMQLVCLNGFDKGTKVKFNGSSLGVRKVYQKIVNAVVAQINSGQDGVAPVVSLAVDSYKHKTYGKVYTPLMKIEKWQDMAALTEALAEPEDEAEDELLEEAPGIEAEAKVEAKVEAEPTEEAPTRRKRRTRG